jgi:predicted RNase H-like nuclease
VSGRVAVGFDGCPAGWVAVTLTDGRVIDVEVVTDLAAAVADRRPAAVAIDMPIGLVDAVRDADVAARTFLPGRASSVFATPPRAVVDGWRAGEVTTHAAATALAVAVTGKGLSQQAWRLVPKIAEVDTFVATLAAAVADGRSPVPVLEVHPELAFTVATGAPLPRKRSWAGISSRRAVLADLGVVLPDRFAGDTLAAPDDVVDAAVCAWVADGAAAGQSLFAVPEVTVQHDRGRPIAIHARRPRSGSAQWSPSGGVSRHGSASGSTSAPTGASSTGSGSSSLPR